MRRLGAGSRHDLNRAAGMRRTAAIYRNWLCARRHPSWHHTRGHSLGRMLLLVGFYPGALFGGQVYATQLNKVAFQLGMGAGVIPRKLRGNLKVLDRIVLVFGLKVEIAECHLQLWV